MSTVWVAMHGDTEVYDAGAVTAIYDNEAAAKEHCDIHNEKVAQGLAEIRMFYEAWAVLSQSVVVRQP